MRGKKSDLVLSNIFKRCFISSCLLFGIVPPFTAIAQTVDTYIVPNGDFEQSTGNESDVALWTDGSSSVGTTINDTCGPTLFGQQHMCVQNWVYPTRRTDISATTLNTTEVITYNFPFCARGQTYTIEFFQYNSSGTKIQEVSNTYIGDPNKWLCGSLETPDQMGIIDPTAVEMRVSVRAPGSRFAIDNIGPITMSYGSEPPPTNEPDLGSDINDALTQVQDISNAIQGVSDLLSAFECGDISSVVGSAGPLTGGSGIGAILKMLTGLNLTALEAAFEDKKRNCQLAAQTETQGAMLESLAAPEPTQPLTVSSDISDITSPTSLRTFAEQTFVNEAGGNDDAVTAMNRANRIAVAQMQFQSEVYDRMLGGPKQQYQKQNGGLVTQSDVNSNSEMEFVEGDYEQTNDRLKELSASINPDYMSRYKGGGGLDKLKQDNATLVDSCLTSSASVNSSELDDVNEGFAALRVKAANTIASTSVGQTICNIADDQTTNVINICIGPKEGLTMNVPYAGEFRLLDRDSLCIYGPKAPSYLNFLFDKLPLLLMFISVVGVIRMFI